MMKHQEIVLTQRAMFIPHSGFARSLSKMDRFAEHLANGVSVKDAAHRVGWDPSHGNAMLQRLRKQLGEQAR